MSDLVRNREDRFSHDAAQLSSIFGAKTVHKEFNNTLFKKITFMIIKKNMNDMNNLDNFLYDRFCLPFFLRFT